MDGSALNWVWGVLFLAMGAVGAWLAPGFWSGRHEQRLHDALAPVGKRLGRSFESTVPLVFLVIGYVGLLIVLTLAFGPGPDEGATTLSTTLSMVLLVLLALLFLVVLFNRPHWAIPPHLRDGHAGLLGGLFHRRSDQPTGKG